MTLNSVVATIVARHPGLRDSEMLLQVLTHNLGSTVRRPGRSVRMSSEAFSVTSLRQAPSGAYRIIGTDSRMPGRILEAEVVVEHHKTIPPSWGTTRSQVWVSSPDHVDVNRKWPGVEIAIGGTP